MNIGEKDMLINITPTSRISNANQSQSCEFFM